MAILATKRRGLVTSRCAASGSSRSFQRLASMYSSSGSNIGNLRISWRYRVRFPSPDRDGAERLAILTYDAPIGCQIAERRNQPGDPCGTTPQLTARPETLLR